MGQSANRKASVIALVALAVVGMGACGETKRLSVTELAIEGNAVCAESDKKLRKAFEEEFAGTGRPTPKQMQAVLRRVVPITEETVAGLRKLEPPEKLEEDFEDALGEAEKAIAALEKGAGTPEAAQALFSAPQDPFARTNKGLERVGITRCSQGAGGGADGGGGVPTTGATGGPAGG